MKFGISNFALNVYLRAQEFSRISRKTFVASGVAAGRMAPPRSDTNQERLT